jgi:hypothetical protein
MTNHTVRSPHVLPAALLLALASGGCDQPQPAPPTLPAESIQSAVPPQPATPVISVDLPPNRFAPKPDAGPDAGAPATATPAETAPDAGAPEAPPPAAPTVPAHAPCSSDADCAAGTCRTYYLDGDDDGYGKAPLSRCDVEPDPPGGYAVAGGDCCDADPNVHPGQLAYFTMSSACGSFDYDCNGTEEPQDPSCKLGCGVACLHSSTMPVPPEACR